MMTARQVGVRERSARVAGWLVLGLLVLGPSVASAQDGPPLGQLFWDYLCVAGKAPCMKFRLGVAGGGILSESHAAPALGLQATVFLSLDESFDLGVHLIALKDVHTQGGTAVLSTEGLMRLGLYRDPRHRLYAELSGGLTFEEERDLTTPRRPSGGVGLCFELGTGGAGAFFRAGLNGVSGERFLAIPSVGVGLNL